jgi:hypothetical protein
MSFGGGSSGGSSTQQVTPYAPAEPALAIKYYLKLDNFMDKV